MSQSARFLLKRVRSGKILVSVDELFLDGAVEALGMGIHLRAFWVSPVVGRSQVLEDLVEGPLELGAVVRQEQDLAGSILGKSGHERLGRAGGVAGVFAGKGHGEGDSQDGVDGGEHRAPDAIAHSFDSVYGPQGERWGFEIFWLSGLAFLAQGFWSAPGIQALLAKAHFAWRAGHDPADRADRGPCHALRLTPRGEQDMEVFLSQVGIKGAQPSDLSHEPWVGLRRPASLGRRGLRGQRRRVASGSMQRSFPAGEGSSGNPKGIYRRSQAVLVKELEDSESFLGIFGGHLPKMSQRGHLVTPRTRYPTR